MKYGSLEWANDLLEHAKSELNKIADIDDNGKAAFERLGITQYYTNLVKSLEDEISKGSYKPENQSDASEQSDTSEQSEDEGSEPEESENEEESITMTCAEYADGDTGLREYLEKVLGNGQHDYDDLVSTENDYYNEDDDKSEDKDVSGLAKSITQNDLGRNL